MSKAAPISFAPAKRGAALIDANSPIHLIVGFTAGILGIDPHAAIAVFVGAKIVEASLREGPHHALFERESGQSLGNEMTDLGLEVLGLHLGEHLRHKLQDAPLATAPAAGIGAYFQDPMYQPISGLGYVR
jgi:hypothetical protein